MSIFVPLIAAGSQDISEKNNRGTGAFGRAGPKTKTKMEEQKRRITKQIHPKILNAKTPERSFWRGFKDLMF